MSKNTRKQQNIDFLSSLRNAESRKVLIFPDLRWTFGN